MTERWCAQGNHFVPREAFDTRGKAGLRRDCRACTAKRLEPALGVDIDRIHFKLGAVAPHLRRSAK